MPRTFRARAATAALAFAALVAAGCGDGGNGGENAAVALTERLPVGADRYVAVDLAALRDGLDLDADADPLSPSAPAPFAIAANAALAGLRGGGSIAPAIDATADLGLATAIAGSESPDGPVVVIATAEDTGEIGSRLGDIGFRDRGGILAEPGRPAAFRLEDGIVFASTAAAALRALPDEPRDEPPDPLLDDLDAPYVETAPTPGGCVRSQGATGEPDGSGEVALLIDGDADADRVQRSTVAGIELGAPEADGDLLTVAARGSPAAAGLAAPEALRSGAVAYDC